LGAC